MLKNIAIVAVLVLSNLLSHSLGKDSGKEARNAELANPVCIEAGVNGVLKLENFSLTIITRLSDGAQQSAPGSVEELLKDSKLNQVECPTE